MRISVFIVLAWLSMLPATGQDLGKSKEDSTSKHTTEAIIFSVLGGYGYDIYVNGKRYIHQETIPSVPGTKGFESEADALKAATLVRQKIENNIMPPSVTPEELDSLGVWEKPKGK